ncbi:hypothetical protein CC78DRAFT_350216 [Lojkania enalia]|uniref:Uncharacterized protein n=1 Tax=Lojkania enalia TaxID=147567 RepID=A0A9P4KJJ6_9PLEO|nr:hypothetical protein CC78DRAFT_350216 [Didymosphaeria enalia]
MIISFSHVISHLILLSFIKNKSWVSKRSIVFLASASNFSALWCSLYYCFKNT